MLLNEMLRHTDFITMGAHTMGTSSIDISPTSSTINAVGLVYEMYGEQFPGTIPVALSGNSPQPPTQNPPYLDEPKTSSGSPTYPLDMIATLTPDHKFLKLAVVNATEKGTEIRSQCCRSQAVRAIKIVATDREQFGCRKPRWAAFAVGSERDSDRQWSGHNYCCSDQRKHLSVSCNKRAVTAVRSSQD